MARRVVGLDLGAYSVKLVRLEHGKQAPAFEVLGSAEEILSYAEDDERELFEKQRDAVLSMQQRGLLEAEVFAIGLEAAQGQMRTMWVPFAESRKIEAILPGMLEAEVPYDIDDMIISWHRVEGELPSAEQPAGEKPEGAKIRLAFGKKQAIGPALQMLQAIPVDPRLMHLGAVAPYELVRELGFPGFKQEPPSADAEHPPIPRSFSAIIDFGHRATNLCIFDQQGLKFSRSFLRGGQKLTEELQGVLETSFLEAQKYKHEKLNLLATPGDPTSLSAHKVAWAHHQELFDEIERTFISLRANELSDVKAVAIIGGASETKGLLEFFHQRFKEHNVSIVPLNTFLPSNISSPSMALSLAYSLSCLQVHAKDSRFNFRKDEFAWRGDLDFLRTKSTPLILWGLVLICSLTVLWSASSLVLEKENQALESRLKNICFEILGQKNIAPKKCLALMKEQISASIDLGFPEFTASDVYLKAAEVIPKELAVTISELDVSEKKVRISGEAPSFEDIDKVVGHLSKIPCFINLERGRATQADSLVKFNLTGDLECNPIQVKPKA